MFSVAVLVAYATCGGDFKHNNLFVWRENFVQPKSLEQRGFDNAISLPSK